MGKRTRLPMEPVVSPGEHEQAGTLGHGNPQKIAGLLSAPTCGSR